MKGQTDFLHEIIVDNFAGGGGASTGIELATGRPVDIAINHDPASIQMHKRNHPYTRHYCENVWDVDPREVTKGRKVALCWFSPDCKHFSKAKGGKPREKRIRGLAWVAVRWAATVKPRVIILENVEEFQTWGPLDINGFPIKKEQGRTFRSFVNALKRQGYEVSWKELRACDYGAPTTRKRLFLIARCDGKPITWPEPTHGEGKLPYRTAAECIDWAIEGKSIFNRKKPLAENTQRRIARGIDKFLLKTGKPFLIQYHSETAGSETRGQEINRPLLTLDTQPRYGLVVPFISKYYAGTYEGTGSSISEPLHTVTQWDHNSLASCNLCVFRNNQDGKGLGEPIGTIMTSPGHYAMQANFLSEYYGNGNPVSVGEPLHTITTKDRNALVQVRIEKISEEIKMGHWPEIRELLNKYCGYNLTENEAMIIRIEDHDYFVSDITLRMLEPRELYKAQGFPPDYIIDFDVDGRKYSKKEQIARCGNSVPPPFAEHLVRANLPELCGKRYTTMKELEEDIAG